MAPSPAEFTAPDSRQHEGQAFCVQCGLPLGERQEAKPPPPAGWYKDPAGTDERRWWDGKAWTHHMQKRHPIPVESVVPPLASRGTHLQTDAVEAGASSQLPPPTSVSPAVVIQSRPTVEAGWFSDPQDPRRSRWWDGGAWTTHVATFAPQPEPEAVGPSVTSGPMRQMSADGAWFWDGAAWQPNDTPSPPKVPIERTLPTATTPPSGPTTPVWPEQPEVWDPVRAVRVRKDGPVEPSAAERAERLGKIAQGHAGALPWRAHHAYGTPRTSGGAKGSASPVPAASHTETGWPTRGVTSSTTSGTGALVRRFRNWLDTPGVGPWSWHGRRLQILMALMSLVVVSLGYRQYFPSVDRTSAAYAYGVVEGAQNYPLYVVSNGANSPGDFCRQSSRFGSADAQAARNSRQGSVDFQTGCLEGVTCRPLAGADTSAEPFAEGAGAAFLMDCSEAGKQARSADWNQITADTDGDNAATSEPTSDPTSDPSTDSVPDGTTTTEPSSAAVDPTQEHQEALTSEQRTSCNDPVQAIFFSIYHGELGTGPEALRRGQAKLSDPGQRQALGDAVNSLDQTSPPLSKYEAADIITQYCLTT